MDNQRMKDLAGVGGFNRAAATKAMADIENAMVALTDEVYSAPADSRNELLASLDATGNALRAVREYLARV